MTQTKPADGTTPEAQSQTPTAPAAKRRPVLLKMARHLRHLDLVARTTERLDAFVSTLLLVKRPRWVDAVLLGMRGATALTKTLDARIHDEISRATVSVWPCHPIFARALQPYYHATYFRDKPWFRLSGHDVVLQFSGSLLYVTNDNYEAVRAAVWSYYDGVMDLRSEVSDQIDAQPGATLLGGHTSSISIDLDADIASGQRRAALLLGKPGMGKSYIIEQVAAMHAARRGAAAGRAGRVMRLPEAALMTTTKLRGVLTHLQPDVLVVHDIDTDKPAPAAVLRIIEMCSELGVVFVATANSVDELHAAALGDHRFGDPVIVDRAPRETIRAVLGPMAVAQADAQGAAAWTRLDVMPLATIARLRRRVEAGGSLLETDSPPTAETCGATANAT